MCVQVEFTACSCVYVYQGKDQEAQYKGESSEQSLVESLEKSISAAGIGIDMCAGIHVDTEFVRACDAITRNFDADFLRLLSCYGARGALSHAESMPVATC